MPGLNSLKRQWERAFSHRPHHSSTSTSTASNGVSPQDASEVSDQTIRCDNPHRASPKTSLYAQSASHSGDTLQDVGDAPLHLALASPSGSGVNVVPVGDDLVRIETHHVDDGSSDPVAMYRSTTGQSTIAPAFPHGPVTIQGPASASGQQKVSHQPTEWKVFSLVHNARRSSQRRKARKGKARLPPVGQARDANTQSPTPSKSLPGPDTVRKHLHFGSMAYESTPASPRTSVSSRFGYKSSTKSERSATPIPASRRTSNDVLERKDSHFPDAVQEKEKATAELHAIINEQLAPAHASQKQSSFLPHIKDWIKQRRNAVVNSSSSSSSSSDAFESRPTSRAARRPPRTRVTRWPSNHNVVAQEGNNGFLHLPPGIKVPAVGDAGPSNWVNRGWEEHYAQLLDDQMCSSTYNEGVIRAEEMQRAEPRYPVRNGARGGSENIKGKGVLRNRPDLERMRSTEDELRHMSLTGCVETGLV